MQGASPSGDTCTGVEAAAGVALAGSGGAAVAEEAAGAETGGAGEGPLARVVDGDSREQGTACSAVIVVVDFVGVDDSRPSCCTCGAELAVPETASFTSLVSCNGCSCASTEAGDAESG